MPDQAAFWDKAARKYAAKPVDDEVAYADTLDRARAYLTRDMTAVELGCGTGTTALKLAGSLGHIAASDISPEMIAIAQEKLAEGGPQNVSFTVGTEADMPDGPVDAVLAFNLLHLVPDLPATLAAIREHLKPGGVFISKTGCVAEAGWLLRRVVIPAMQLVGKAPYVNPLTQSEVDRQITSAGFEIVETHSYSGIAPTRFVVARRV